MSKETVNIGVNMHNRFDFKVRTLPSWYRMFPRGWWPRIRKILDIFPFKFSWLWGRVTSTAEAENIVLTQLYPKLVTALTGTSGYPVQTNTMGYVHLGSGTTTPAASQTQLTTLVRALASSFNSSTPNTNNMGVTIVRIGTVDAGVGIGEVYREVGFASSAGGTTLNTRALIKDGNGDPLTITKADLQVVTITGTWYCNLVNNYGPNFGCPGTWPGGTGTCIATTAGWAWLWGAQVINGVNNAVRSSAFRMRVGSSGTAVAPSNNVAVLAANAWGSNALTVTGDAGNARVTWSIRVPSTVSGTIKEFGFECDFYNPGYSGSVTAVPIFRFILPIGNNAPDYNNIYATDNIVKNSTNVIDVALVLQFGSPA